jgi:hypothetical protein
MTKLGELSDAEVLARAHHWRGLTLRGCVRARSLAHAYEAEARRRFSVPTTAGTLERTRPAPPRSLWHFWRS